MKKKTGEYSKSSAPKLSDESSFLAKEAFRNLVSNIGFSLPKKENGFGKIICISSSVPGEGKSTVAVNAAMTFARTGASTILVDCDLRKPRIRRFFHFEKEQGLAEYIAGNAEYEQVVNKDVLPNLDVIGAIRGVPNPTVLINSSNFSNLLEHLSQTYEYVIIDTPPINIVSDGIVVGSKADGVALVVRKDMETHKFLSKAITSLEFAGCNFIGFILNDFNLEDGKKYNYYYYYYK